MMTLGFRRSDSRQVLRPQKKNSSWLNSRPCRGRSFEYPQSEVAMGFGQKGETFRSLIAILCAVVLSPGDTLVYAQQQSAPPASAQSVNIPADQLDSLVAPIALYPDPLLAQVLAASTYPLEIVLLQQRLKNNTLKDKALADAVAKQPWDPSVQALAALPDLVKLLGGNIQWTADLGNAFLSQQGDVMDAVQRMRKKAQDKGNLKTSEQQTVETKVVENKSVVVIEQANPQVVYVPSYDPVVVYGALILSVSSGSCLSAVGILRRRHGDLLRRGRDDGSVLGRRLGLGLRLGL